MNIPYSELHAHSCYSVLDGLPTPEEYVIRAKELGLESMALTDHGSLSGHRDMYKAGVKHDMKIILGCLMPGQEIHTRSGMKAVEDIAVGDEVLTHKGRYKRVKMTMVKNYSGGAREFILAKDGGTLRNFVCTDEHPILISDANGKEEWVRADEVEFGYKAKSPGLKRWKSYAVMPKLQDSGEKIFAEIPTDAFSAVKAARYNIVGDDFVSDSTIKHMSGKVWSGWGRSIEITEEFAKFLGYYVAEGSVAKSGNGAFVFSFGPSEQEYVDFCVSIMRGMGVYCDVRQRPEKSLIEIVGCHQPLANFFAHYCGVGAHNKKVPEFLTRCPENIVRSFLEGLCDGDGKWRNNGRSAHLKVSSINLAWGVRALATKMGSYSDVCHVKAFTPKGHPVTHYSIEIYFKRAEWGRSLVLDDKIISPISRIEKFEYTGPVYNFEVEDDNSYVSKFALHNCEAYFNPGEVGEKLSKARRDEGENAYHHVILLAKNDNGLRNLNLMSAEAWRTDFYQKPRVAMELLEKYKEDIIVSAACVGGVIGRSIMNDDLEAARDWAIKFKELMGDDFYGEIHDSDDLIKPGYTKTMLEIMDSLDIPTIITSDCHYAREEDLWLEEALLILNTNPKKNPEYDGSKAQTMSMLEKFNYLYPDRRMTFQEVQVYLSSAQTKREKLLRWGIEREDVFHNTVEISEKIGG